MWLVTERTFYNLDDARKVVDKARQNILEGIGKEVKKYVVEYR